MAVFLEIDFCRLLCVVVVASKVSVLRHLLPLVLLFVVVRPLRPRLSLLINHYTLLLDLRLPQPPSRGPIWLRLHPLANRRLFLRLLTVPLGELHLELTLVSA